VVSLELPTVLFITVLDSQLTFKDLRTLNSQTT